MRKRRTRKEKIIASLHRKLHKQLPVENMRNEEKKLSIPITPVLSIRSDQSAYFMADLKKSLILTSVIIILELLLFIIQSRLT